MTLTRRIFLSAAALGFGAGAYGLYQSLNSEPAGFATPAKAEDLSDLMTPGPLGDKILGKSEAPVTIVEYASMTCGHCAAFHTDTLPGIKKKYIDTGKAKLVFREFPFDPRATAAFMLARCAEDEHYFALVDTFFRQADRWVRVEDPRGPMLQITKLAGFTQDSFKACLQRQEVLDAVNAVRKRGQEKYGVNSTPTFFINGEKHAGNMSVEEMSKLIDKHL